MSRPPHSRTPPYSCFSCGLPAGVIFTSLELFFRIGRGRLMPQTESCSNAPIVPGLTQGFVSCSRYCCCRETLSATAPAASPSGAESSRTSSTETSGTTGPSRYPWPTVVSERLTQRFGFKQFKIQNFETPRNMKYLVFYFPLHTLWQNGEHCCLDPFSIRIVVLKKGFVVAAVLP